ncbi:MAG: type II secretion system F family protein [Nitrospinae bacterium]|nr:type II secretion system F family protein [Nitrospinota bacterium]
MPEFIYSAKTRGGVLTDGVIEAKTKEEAQAILQKQFAEVVKLKKAPMEIHFGKPKISEKDVVIFTRQFSTMIDAGLPLVQCLGILSTQTENKAFGKKIGEIKTSVEGGDTFSDALRKHPDVFDNLFTNMIEAGEVGGILDTILNRLANYIEKSLALKKKIKSALTYPIVILVIAFVIVAGLLVFVIPVFVSMFEDMGKEVPALTLFVMKLSEIFQNYVHYLLGIGFLVIHLIKRYYKTENGRLNMDALFLKLPVAGSLIQKVSVAKFTRTLGTLLASGVPIIEALDITARTAGNKIVENAIFGIIGCIKEGQTMTAPLSREKVFPPMVVSMIDIGEASGALDTMLNKIADFYDEEVDTAVEAMTSLLEPMLMVFLGITIGTIVVAMYLPIFKMGEVI